MMRISFSGPNSENFVIQLKDNFTLEDFKEVITKNIGPGALLVYRYIINNTGLDLECEFYFNQHKAKLTNGVTVFFTKRLRGGGIDIHHTNTKYLPEKLVQATGNYENESCFYDHSTGIVSLKLLETNPYISYLKQVYPIIIKEDSLTQEMIDILQRYTVNHYLKTNINLLTNYDIDWDYTNKLRSLIRGLYQNNLQSIYYRGLKLTDIEINYFKEKINTSFYTTSFYSFTTDKCIAFSGNAIMNLKTRQGNRLNIANVWKWSLLPNEKEAILSIGSKLQILNVSNSGEKWEIEVELISNE